MKANPIDRQAFDLITVRVLLGANQIHGVAGFVATCFQHVDLRDETTIGIHQDVGEIAVVVLAVLTATSFGIVYGERFALGVRLA